MSNIWVTSDTHFGHKSILKFCPETRPFDNVSDMDEELINSWNECVKPNDTIYHLGDFSFHNESNTEHILRKLNGNIILILGNHDKIMNRSSLKKYFELQTDYYTLKINKKKICMFHYPIFEWDGMHRGAFHIHGHLHSSRILGHSMDIGVDSRVSMQPYNIDEIIEILSKNETLNNGYH